MAQTNPCIRVTRDDKIFMVARAMARHDGHDPDQSVLRGPLLDVRGLTVLPFGACKTIPLWELYAGLAAAAVDALRCLQKE